MILLHLLHDKTITISRDVFIAVSNAHIYFLIYIHSELRVFEACNEKRQGLLIGGVVALMLSKGFVYQ